MSPLKSTACPTPSLKTSSRRLSKADVELHVSMLKALSNPIRLRIVDVIRQRGGDVCVCEFESAFKLTQPTISHHLKILRESGLIVSRQEGTWVHHSIDPRAFGRLELLIQSFAATPVEA